ncbi:YcdB/YcdC domain-containing protein [Tepidanaerobacter acetatoxydans]|uniref:YcdB/YcdC domain-containing protein n=1 Tax=Tepidanaerobacter acetatoxydans TaxID=499229 RepID=UPI001BD38E2B|nr:YcdB/YcdC domain-containing protein [Tepidanaerobacter acetatoxydans]
MKKLLSLVLVLTFAFSIVSPAIALADTSISQEKAIEKIKKIFDTTIYDRFNINYNEDDGNKKVWELYWSTSKAPYGSLSASIDAETGNILNMYMNKGYDPDRKTSAIPKYSREQAIEIAKTFAEKLQPSEFAKTKLINREEIIYPLSVKDYDDSYFFNFTRIESNIPVENDGLGINVDAHTGEVVSYSFNWSWEPLPSAEKVISPEDAEKIFSDKEGLKLVYQRYYDYRTQEENIKLVYTLSSQRFLIDAITGELINDVYYDNYSMGAAEAQKVMDSDFTPAETKEVEITKNCISKDAAVNIVKKYISIPNDYKQNWANLYEDYDNPDQKVWSISWEKSDENGEGGSIYARVNAVTSELLSFDFYDYSNQPKEFKQNYDRTAAQKKAEEFLEKFQPERFKDVKLEEVSIRADEPEKMREHNFTYTRIVNGIPYTANGFNLTVDAQNGNIIRYRMQWHERNFPSTDGILTKADAEARFLRDIGLELVYASIYNPKDDTNSYRLVYRPKTAKSYTFDASDFKPLDYKGKPIEEDVKTIFTDIKGHWAENDIQLLIDLGVIKSAEDKFYPDESITEGEFIKLLLIAKNQRISDNMESQPAAKSEADEEIQKYVDAALKLGWIKSGEVDIKRSLSREKAAAFVVRAMGLEKVACLSDIYKDIAKDSASIKPEYKGHATIAMGLKLLSADNGNFKPKTDVTRAQAATILVKMLKSDSSQ